MSTLCFFSQFTTSGLGADDLTVTVDIAQITRADGTQTALVTAGSGVQITAPNKRGLYFYRLTGADLTLYDYAAVFITSGTADLKEVPALWSRFSEGDSLTNQMTESYNADGVAPTPAQALFVIMQMLTELSISGTTVTVKKIDGSTTAFTLTLNSATTPTSTTRAP